MMTSSKQKVGLQWFVYRKVLGKWNTNYYFWRSHRSIRIPKYGRSKSKVCIQIRFLYRYKNGRLCIDRIFALRRFVYKDRCLSLDHIEECCQSCHPAYNHKIHSHCRQNSNDWPHIDRTCPPSLLACNHICHLESIVSFWHLEILKNRLWKCPKKLGF